MPVSCFINSIYDKTVWNKVRSSVMSSCVTSVGHVQELTLDIDKYIWACFKDDDSVANPGVSSSYMKMVTAKCSQCNGK